MFPLFFVFLLIVPIAAKPECGDLDMLKISGCSSSSFPLLYTTAAPDYRKDMFERFNDSQRVKHLCMLKEKFETCINKYDNTIIEKCFNVQTAKKYQFGQDENTDRRLISYYYQLGYICDEKNSWALEQKESVINALKACESVYPKMCHNVPTYLDCVRNATIDKCNSAAMACYAQKFAAFQSCYDIEDCDMCYSLGSTTNRITTLSYEDTRTNNIDNTTSTISTTKSTTSPSSTTSTTTATTTTTITTTANTVNVGLQNAISFVQLLAAFAIAFY